MKKMIFSLVIMATVMSFVSQAQNAITDFQKGTVVTASNEKLEGNIRDLSKNKGTIVFESAGKKKTYTPSELSGFILNGNHYISYSGDFYKVIIPAGKAGLYQRVSDNSGKMMYNGAEAVLVSTAEGKPGDFYIQSLSDGKWSLVSQKNFETVALNSFVDCPSVLAEIKTKQLDFAQLAKAVEHYNSCK
ncbi:MAG: hypothetical protein V4557_09095 [Bacteroidota bacterium]